MKNTGFRLVRSKHLLMAGLCLFLLPLFGCDNKPAGDGSDAMSSDGKMASGEKLSGEIKIDGSSTVEPISSAVAEEFQKANPDVRITVNQSGTGGGFKKFTNKETDISDASRPIKTEEEAAATSNSIEYIELPIAYDGLAVVVNPKNTWANCLTKAELNKIWMPGSKVTTWDQVRVGFPKKPIKLYGAGTDSGTFDYFTDAINGKEGASRSDYSASEDDNALVTGVAGDEGGLGYFGLAYYEQSKDKLKLLGVDGAKGCVEPSEGTVNDGTYQPLSRPLFIYISKESANRPEVQAFVKFYLGKEGRAAVKSAGYVPLPDSAYELVLKRFESGTTGSVFSGGSQVGVKIEDLLSKESNGAGKMSDDKMGGDKMSGDKMGKDKMGGTK